MTAMTEKTSMLLFLGACIPLRLALAYASTRIPAAYMPIFAVFLLLVAVGILYLYFTNARMSAPEAGGATWWAHYRLLIGALWLVAAIYAFQGRNDMVWIPLVIDVIFGLVIFYLRHF